MSYIGIFTGRCLKWLRKTLEEIRNYNKVGLHKSESGEGYISTEKTTGRRGRFRFVCVCVRVCVCVCVKADTLLIILK
jgi:hypothetical protein